MAFIRTRKIKYDENNKIISGTAAIIESKYVSGNLKYHSKQIVRERLGKVIELYSKKERLFLSPTRVPVNSLKRDTAFFAMMADDRVKLSFFSIFC